MKPKTEDTETPCNVSELRARLITDRYISLIAQYGVHAAQQYLAGFEEGPDQASTSVSGASPAEGDRGTSSSRS